MPAFVKTNALVEHIAERVHDFENHEFMVALTNTAPEAETTNPMINTADAVLANLTEIPYTHISSRVISVTSSGQTAGIYKWILENLPLIIAGGTAAEWQYVWIYNNTVTGKPLLGYYKYQDPIILNDGERITITFDAVQGAIKIS